MLYKTSMLKIRQNRAEVDIDANQRQGDKVHIGARAGGGEQGLRKGEGVMLGQDQKQAP